MQQSGHSQSSQNYQAFKAKNFQVNYDPERNKNNIFARKLNKELPQENQMFAQNPLTKMMQPQDISKSKRFVRDKLNISDIPGAKPDVYKNLRYIEGREYIDANDIQGAQPTQLKQSKPRTGPDYKLFTKDINPDKWQSKRIVDPLRPEYELPTKSGRKMIIGQIEKSAPKTNISPQTKRIANYVRDIDGTEPRRGNSITDDQRNMATGKFNLNISSTQLRSNTRNTIDPSLPAQQQQILNQSLNHDGPVPNSHYARFQSYKSQLNTIQETNNIQKPPIDPQLRSSYRIRQSAQYQLQNSSHATILQQDNEPINKERKTLLNQVQSRRQNTYQLLEQSILGNNNGQNNGSQSNRAYFNVQNQSQDQILQQIKQGQQLQESPDTRQRTLWSKAQNINVDIDQQQNRVNSSNQNGYNFTLSKNAAPAISKQNFQDNLYQRAVQLNSGHNSGQVIQSSNMNPISNEINRSLDSVAFSKVQKDRNDRLSNSMQRYNPINNQVNDYQKQTQSYNQSPIKMIVPQTTQKSYGNFMDVKQLDTMIRELKQASNHSIL